MSQSTNIYIYHLVGDDDDQHKATLPPGLETFSWDDLKLCLRGIFSRNASVEFDNDSRKAIVHCQYQIGNARIKEKLGGLLDAKLIDFQVPISGFTEEENDRFMAFKSVFNLNPNRVVDDASPQEEDDGGDDAVAIVEENVKKSRVAPSSKPGPSQPVGSVPGIGRGFKRFKRN